MTGRTIPSDARKPVNDAHGALGLLNSMVYCGERHSETSEKIVETAFEALKNLNKSAGALAILKERIRQVDEEHWDEAHDEDHTNGDLALAAAAYIVDDGTTYDGKELAERLWPWSKDYWKPSGDRIRDLEKAGALIAAEIDRLNNLKAKEAIKLLAYSAI